MYNWAPLLTDTRRLNTAVHAVSCTHVHQAGRAGLDEGALSGCHFSAGSRFPSNTNLTALKRLGEHSQLSSQHIGLRHETRGTLQVYCSVHKVQIMGWVSNKTANWNLVIEVNWLYRIACCDVVTEEKLNPSVSLVCTQPAALNISNI